MKLLIVTAWYHPFIHPRAHRWTALAEYWAATGHKVHVLTARHRDCPDEAMTNGVYVHRAGFDSLKEVAYFYFGSKNARGRIGAEVRKPGFFARLTAWIYNVIWKKIYFPDDACLWYFPAKNKARQLLERENFDALITVSLPFTGHLIGLRLRNLKGFVNLRPIWLADIGDPFSIQAKPLNNSFLYGKISRRLEQKVLEDADAVTVTTAFTLQKYREQFGEKAVANMSVVPPLLHPEPSLSYHQSPTVQRPASIKIGYFGALYAPVRTPYAFLDLLEKSFALRPELRERLEIYFYGEIFPEFFEKLSAQPAVRLHGLRTREETQAAMRDMDILLNIGNTTDFQLPSKAVEYLAAGKPILNLSYTEGDPFAAFFDDKPLVFNLKVENAKVGDAEIRRWLAWLEEEKKLPDVQELERRTTPYKLATIASRYFDLLASRVSRMS